MKRYFFRFIALILVLGLLMPEEGILAAEISSNVAGRINWEFEDNLKSNSETDVFTIKLTKPGSLYINFSHGKTDGLAAWNIQLFDENGKQIIDGRSFDRTDYNTPKARLPEGVYLIKVFNGSIYYSDIKYKIVAKYAEESSPLFEKEWNDTRDAAYEIETNKTYTGNLLNGTDIDFFRFSLKDPGSLSIRFLHGKSDGLAAWDIFIYDNKDKLVLEGRSFDRTDYTSGTVRLPAGKYYVRVSNTSIYFNDMDYQMSLRFKGEAAAGYEKEWNDTLESAYAIAPNTTYTGNLSGNGDIDCYMMKTSKAASMYIRFRHDKVDGLAAWNAQLVDKSGKVFIDGRSFDNTDYSTSSVRLPAGIYYLKVHNNSIYFSNADYSFNIVSPELIPPLGIKLNGKVLKLKHPLGLYGSEITGNAQDISAALGAFFAYNAKNKTVTIKKNKTSVIYKIGSKTCTVNRKKVTIAFAPFIKSSAPYISIKSLAGALDYKYNYDTVTRTASIVSSNVTGYRVRLLLPGVKGKTSVSGKIKVDADVADSQVKSVDYYVDNIYVTSAARGNGFTGYIDTSKFKNGTHGIAVNGRYLKSNDTKDIVYGSACRVVFKNTEAGGQSEASIEQIRVNKKVGNTNYEITPNETEYYYPKQKFLLLKLNSTIFVGIKNKSTGIVSSKSKNPELVWELGNKGILKIDDYGSVSALKKGICDLYLKTKDGKICDYIRASVYDDNSGYTLLATRMPSKKADGTDYLFRDGRYGIDMMAIDHFNCKKDADGKYLVTMDIYNRYLMTPVLYTYDSGWDRVESLFIGQYKLPSSIGSVGKQYLASFNEITSGKYFSNYYDNRSETSMTKTPINIKVPAGGAVKITLSARESDDVLIYNSLDIIFKVWQNTREYKELVKKNDYFKKHPNLEQLVSKAKLANIIRAKLKTGTMDKFREELIKEITGGNPLNYPYVVYTKFMNFYKAQDIDLKELAAGLVDINAVGNASVGTVKSILEDSVLDKVPDGKILKESFALLNTVDIDGEVSDLLYNWNENSVYIFFPQ